MATFDAFTEQEEEAPGNTQRDSFFLRNNFVLTRVQVREILWLQAEGNYCSVVTNDKKLMVKLSLRKLFLKMPAGTFVRIHRTYIVQVAHIQKIDIRENIVTISDIDLPLGKNYKDPLLNALEVI